MSNDASSAEVPTNAGPAPAPVPPFRFRTPPGWPEPSPDWVARHQLTTPPPGWTPAPDTTPAPVSWRFWRVDLRVFRTYLPASARRLHLGVLTGIVLVAVGVAATAILGAARGPAALGLVPLVVGIALVLVLGVRLVDASTVTARSIAADAARWRATGPRSSGPTGPTGPTDQVGPWPELGTDANGVPYADQLGRRSRIGLRIASAAAAAVVVAGAVTAVVPVLPHGGAGETLGIGLQEIGPSDPAAPRPSQTPGSTPSPDGGSGSDSSASGDAWWNDDHTIRIQYLDDSDATWFDTCGATPLGDRSGDCAPVQFTSTKDCDAVIHVGFEDTEDGSDVGEAAHSVHLTAGVPLQIGEQFTQDWFRVEDASCTGYAPTTYDQHATAGSLTPDSPEMCDESGCAVVVLHPDTRCYDASVQFAVTDADGTRRDVAETGDLVPGQALALVVGSHADGVPRVALTQAACGF